MFALIRLTLRESLASARKQLAERRNRRALYAIALGFNKVHCWKWKEPRWMCPQCNAVHESTGSSLLTGLQYPGCCNITAGHRHFREHAAGLGR